MAKTSVALLAGEPWTDIKIRNRIRELEADCGRARAVSRLLDQLLPHVPEADQHQARVRRVVESARVPRRSKERPRRHVGHPARLSRLEKRKAREDPDSWMRPEDAEIEKGTQEVNRLMRKLGTEGQYAGAVSRPLAVASVYAAAEHAKNLGYEGEEMNAAMAEWIIQRLGEVVGTFDEDAFMAWRYQERG